MASTFSGSRRGRVYIHYADERDQLSDLAADPREDVDLAARHGETRRDLEGELRSILDPDAVNRRAFADQARRLAALGGRAAVPAMADKQFGYTPIDPGMMA